MLTYNTGDSVFSEVQCPQFVEAGNVTGNIVKIVVVQSEVLEHGAAGEQAQGEDGQSVVVQG